MNKKTILIAAGIVLGLTGLMLLGRSGQSTGVSQGLGSHTGEISQSAGSISSLTALEKTYDFGTISMKNGLVNHAFRITNSSDKDVLVKKVFTSCMCTAAYIEGVTGEKGPFGMEGHGYLPPADEIIAAGESRDIKVVYDPNAHGPAGVGSINRVVYLVDASGGALQLGIKAVVTP